jgi:hypothetical protein
MTKKAKFSKGLDLKQPKALILAVSIDNKKQTLEDFEAFVELANRHKKRISGIRVVLSCYLQRHYVGSEEARKFFDNWKEENGSFLKKFTISIEEVEAKSWETIIKDPRYDEAFKKVQEEYTTNEDFKNIVARLARKFAWKKSFEAARNYLLDECAGLLVLSYDGVIAYPHFKLGDAADYFLNKYNPHHHYAGYELHLVKSHKSVRQASVYSLPNNEEGLISACFGLSKMMELNGIFGPKKQSKFFEKFVVLKEEFVSQTINMDEENDETQTYQGRSQATAFTQ